MPHHLSDADLDGDAPLVAARDTLDAFRAWSGAHPEEVAAHVYRWTAHLPEPSDRHRLQALIRHRPDSEAARAAEATRLRREALRRHALSLGEVPSSDLLDRIVADPRRRPPSSSTAPVDAVDTALERIRAHAVLRRVPASGLLRERITRLYAALPEEALAGGAMDRAARTIGRVLAIGSHDTLDADPEATAAHLGRVVHGAYALAVAQAVVDLPAYERNDAHHRLLPHLLSEIEPVPPAGVPDDPLAEELHAAHVLLLTGFPFAEHRLLYRATEVMYLARARAERRTRAEALRDGGETLLVDAMVETGAGGIAATLVGRRAGPGGPVHRHLVMALATRLRHDLLNRARDAVTGRLTPFTLAPRDLDGDPLHDLFAAEAYMVATVFGGDPETADALAHHGSARLVAHLARDRFRIEEWLQAHRPTPEIEGFLRSAARIAHRRSGLALAAPAPSRARPSAATDPRTFAADRSGFVDTALTRYASGNDARGPRGVPSRSPGGPEGPLRPALTLMLAEGAAMDPAPLAPLVAAVELFHTGSLALDERFSHLTGIALISSGYALMARMADDHPEERVIRAITRVGVLLGPERLCRGRHLDRVPARGGEPADPSGFLEVYALTTSTEIEVALIPAAILLGLPDHEIDLLTSYAHHAGIVLRVRSELLADSDGARSALVGAHGRATAARTLAAHRDLAEAALDGLALDTGLLRGVLDHFATRRR
ncbi:hypothetical protein [Nocardiopsis lambiniae]|uniref:Uncharacterized protein n=1 Tax=Nocardiopsis lambiniae TaxID=3075539 RepID=A0ABU2M499_9ACTN|nr:hypothetical protein [Nocardiopsis sp. DSM 44743]MDT0327473.1 hypothetical protein [Nocardiopsis sp. DSM 44743]